jgi:hypothetical protein
MSDDSDIELPTSVTTASNMPHNGAVHVTDNNIYQHISVSVLGREVGRDAEMECTRNESNSERRQALEASDHASAPPSLPTSHPDTDSVTLRAHTPELDICITPNLVAGKWLRERTQGVTEQCENTTQHTSTRQSPSTPDCNQPVLEPTPQTLLDLGLVYHARAVNFERSVKSFFVCVLFTASIHFCRLAYRQISLLPKSTQIEIMEQSFEDALDVNFNPDAAASVLSEEGQLLAAGATVESLRQSNHLNTKLAHSNQLNMMLAQSHNFNTMLAAQVTGRQAAEMQVKQLQAQQQDMMLEILHLQSELNAHQASLHNSHAILDQFPKP